MKAIEGEVSSHQTDYREVASVVSIRLKHIEDVVNFPPGTTVTVLTGSSGDISLGLRCRALPWERLYGGNYAALLGYGIEYTIQDEGNAGKKWTTFANHDSDNDAIDGVECGTLKAAKSLCQYHFERTVKALLGAAP